MIGALGSFPLGAGAEDGAGPVPVIGSAALALRIHVLDADAAAGAVSVAAPLSSAGVWAVLVEVDSTDVSDWVVGEVTVEFEENTARVADFTLVLPQGEILTPTNWTGRDVTISLADMTTGTPLNAVVLFTGSIELPRVDLDRRALSLRCSDNRQAIIAALSKDQIAALMPDSRWSPVVFDSGASSWTTANDRLSTVAASLDVSPLGKLRVTPWAAKAVPDISFGPDMVLDGGMVPELAERSGLINRVDITFGYRFPRIKAEGYVVSYDYLAVHNTGFVYWVRDGHPFLQRSTVVAAIEAAGASIVEIVWTALPTEPQIIPGTGGAEAGAWLPNPAADALVCLGFTALVTFDYAQEQEEEHKITVACAASVEAVGVVRDSMSGALEGKYVDLVAAEESIRAYRQRSTTLPPRNVAPVAAGATNAITAALTTDTNRAAANDAMTCLMAIASTKIKRAHRENAVPFSVPCWPTLDLDKTVAVQARGVAAKGKVRRGVHRLNPDNGTAITECTLAVSRAAGVGFNHTEDELSSPAGTKDGQTVLSGMPVVTWNGLAGQDQKITITFPGVEDRERFLAQSTITSTLAVAVDEDVLEIVI